MNPKSNFIPRSFSDRDKGILFIGLSLIAIFKMVFLSFEIEKIPFTGSSILLAVEIIVFTLVLKKEKFNQAFFSQWVLVVCYMALFFYLLSTTGKLFELLAVLKKFLTPNLLLSVVALAFGAGVLEEILFRKILLDFFQKGMSTRWAIFWTSFAFFFLHFTFNPILFLTGILYANLALRFKSLIAVILLHGFYDFAGYLSKIKGLETTHLSESLTASEWLAGSNSITEIIFFGLVLLYILVAWIWNKFKSRDVATTEKAETYAHPSNEI